MQALVEQALGQRVTLVPAEPESEPQYCAECNHAGWVYRHVALHDPDFGKLFPCPECHAPKLRQERIDRVFGTAQIPPEYDGMTFGTYPRDGDQFALAALITLSQEPPRSVFLHGRVGVGKTALALCLMQAWIAAGHVKDALFITTIDLLDRIRATYSDQAGANAEDVLNVARSTSLLVLDDFGRERIQPGDRGAWVRERLFGLVDHRKTQQLPTIYTSNQSITELERHGDDATSWRVRQMCFPYIVLVDGANLREVGEA